MESKIKIRQVEIDITAINPHGPLNLTSAWRIMDVIRDRVVPHPACKFFVIEPRNPSGPCYDATANIVRLYTPHSCANQINENGDGFISCVADFMSKLIYPIHAEIPEIDFSIVVRLEYTKSSHMFVPAITELFYDSKDEDAFLIHGEK